jgi:hypothetical protein
VTPSANAPVIENPFNLLLSQKHYALANAQRYALGTSCDPTGAPLPPTKAQIARQLKTIQINATAAGDNIVIPALAGLKRIYELVMWNVATQEVLWQQGLTGNTPITLLDLVGFPSTTGFTLGFNGNFDQSHWDIDNNQPLVVNLSAGTQVTGFIRYRIANGTEG